MNTSFVYIIIILIMFLWTMRTNKKNQQQAQKLQDSLKPGMYVMLKDGLYGTIVDVMDDDVVINFSVDGADEGCLTVGKSGIYNVIEDSAAAEPKADGTAASGSAPESIEERVKRAEQLEIAENDEAEITDEHAGEAETEAAEPDNTDNSALDADTAEDNTQAADTEAESAAEDKEEC